VCLSGVTVYNTSTDHAELRRLWIRTSLYVAVIDRLVFNGTSTQ